MFAKRHLGIVLSALVLLVIAALVMRLARKPETASKGNPAPPAETPSAESAPDVPTGHDSDTTTRPTLFATDIHKKWQEIDDPSQDGWDTEAFTLRAAAQFKKLGRFLTGQHAPTQKDLSELATENLNYSPLLPLNLETVFQDRSIEVKRLQTRDASQSGQSGFGQAIQALAQPFYDADNARIKFKIIQVQRDDHEMVTRQLVELSGRLPKGVLEQHATWETRWTEIASEKPKLTALRVVEFEQTRVVAPHRTLFADCTQSAIGHNEIYSRQFLRGYNDWLAQMNNTRYFVSLSTPGLAVGDVNGDGREDLYVCQEQGLPNRLFLQQADGTADEVSSDWEVDWLQDSRSALFVDLDNDGDQDLVVALVGGLLFASNDANQRFQIETMVPTSEDLMSISAADFDNDGDLDLYATGYFPDQFIEHSHAGGLPTGVDNFVYHDSNLGGRNALLRNDTEADRWKFIDATESVGLESNNARFSFMGSWDDFDNDGDQDLYVANDYGRDNLYRNDGGRFVDIAEAAGAEDAASGMSVTWGDFDRDGWMDIYISNMWSSAGKRISSQPRFKKNAPEDIRRRLQRFARGNTLLRNNGNGSFRDQGADAGVEIGRWAWGSLFADINNDGWEDLLIGNGYITGDDSTGDL